MKRASPWVWPTGKHGPSTFTAHREFSTPRQNKLMVAARHESAREAPRVQRTHQRRVEGETGQLQVLWRLPLIHI